MKKKTCGPFISLWNFYSSNSFLITLILFLVMFYQFPKIYINLFKGAWERYKDNKVFDFNWIWFNSLSISPRRMVITFKIKKRQKFKTKNLKLFDISSYILKIDNSWRCKGKLQMFLAPPLLTTIGPCTSWSRYCQAQFQFQAIPVSLKNQLIWVVFVFVNVIFIWIS